MYNSHVEESKMNALVKLYEKRIADLLECRDDVDERLRLTFLTRREIEGLGTPDCLKAAHDILSGLLDALNGLRNAQISERKQRLIPILRERYKGSGDTQVIAGPRRPPPQRQ
jgi:hypothetical protein